MSIEGRWRIVEMEVWDREAIDLLGPAFIEIATDGQGRSRFTAVEGWMDIREVKRDGRVDMSRTRSVQVLDASGKLLD